MIWHIAKRECLSNVLTARFAIGFLLCLVLIPFAIIINLDDYGNQTRIGVLLLTSIVFFSVFILIGLLISTRSKSSITSIIVCLFFWVFFIFLAPNLSVYLAESMLGIPSRDTLDFSIRDLENEYENKCEAYSYRELEYPVWWNRSSNSGDDGAVIISNCAKSFFEWTRKGFEYSVPLRIEYADKKWALQKAYLDNLNRQRSVAEKISLMSPAEIFRLTASIVCRTSVDSHHRFMERTRWYREEFIDYLESKNFLSSYIWFTPIPEEKFLTANEFFTSVSEGEIDNIEEWDRRINAQNGLATGLWKRSVPNYFHDDYPFLNVSEVPQFQFQSERLIDTLLPILSQMGGLILTSIVLFYLAFLSFMKFDVG